MTADLIFFFLLAIIAVVAAVGMVRSRNTVYSALYLVLNMATLALFYLILGAPFIAMAQITIYAGAIMVLFLFVIMLLGTEQLAPTDNLPWQRPVALILAAALVVEAVYVFFFRRTLPEAVVQALPDGFGGPVNIGEVLFNQYLLPFEVTSVILLVAMIGAIVLSRRT
ncbi:MAG: NADH-quinone oxidoreductase subunit J [Chloroflexi bacterium]|jgi:NADH-quinone oxidoreductase subunit J|nr:NADH-quinone oxidoreductase subunit J [Chloroflexota bacterium]